jgi:hypothetical protein
LKNRFRKEESRETMGIFSPFLTEEILVELTEDIGISLLHDV